MVAIKSDIQNVQYEITCDQCNIELSYGYGDIQHDNKEYYGKDIYYEYVVCPRCGAKCITYTTWH